jgi:hypothetical protein
MTVTENDLREARKTANNHLSEFNDSLRRTGFAPDEHRVDVFDTLETYEGYSDFLRVWRHIDEQLTKTWLEFETAVSNGELDVTADEYHEIRNRVQYRADDAMGQLIGQMDTFHNTQGSTLTS